MKYLRWLLLPFSLIYGLVVIIRNWCYDAGVFKSEKFNIPVISVGNLEVGGAGKSPMTEYLIRLLKNDYKLATLSRGYGRETKGYLEYRVSSIKYQEIESQESRVKNQDIKSSTQNLQPATYSLQLSYQIGDEPAQFKHKFPDITVAVCEKRVEGIKQLIPDHNLIILDDAYQHRAVEPGLSILLFDYGKLNEPHFLLPAGNFREPFSGRWRAQIVIATKCPVNLSVEEQGNAVQKLKPLPYQSVFLTSIAYQQLQNLDSKASDFVIDSDTTVFLLTGIANPKPLLNHLNGLTTHIIHHNYPDHHPFTLKNITKLANEFLACASAKKIIVTTEKDAQRLEQSWFKQALPGFEKPPVCVLPIQVKFLNDSGERFNQLIFDYVRQHPAFGSIH
jgi:tetraacyldisaccharide 4'-kinase